MNIPPSWGRGSSLQTSPNVYTIPWKILIDPICASCPVQHSLLGQTNGLFWVPLPASGDSSRSKVVEQSWLIAVAPQKVGEEAHKGKRMWLPEEAGWCRSLGRQRGNQETTQAPVFRPLTFRKHIFYLPHPYIKKKCFWQNNASGHQVKLDLPRVIVSYCPPAPSCNFGISQGNVQIFCGISLTRQ